MRCALFFCCFAGLDGVCMSSPSGDSFLRGLTQSCLAPCCFLGLLLQLKPVSRCTWHMCQNFPQGQAHFEATVDLLQWVQCTCIQVVPLMSVSWAASLLCLHRGQVKTKVIGALSVPADLMGSSCMLCKRCRWCLTIISCIVVPPCSIKR